ncbi:NADP-dependent oxidoreductase [Labrys monachus]|uniref:NADPH:quinone reductase-like Zn-dependent oxidoreductase n=1 Tax=Labrys monachus TaxID=217067 RepID=A0ABU0FGK3_9HYPH|nr:NADP-dependent oxidoreductase [Labrys monachus]MDQ0393746.1 NADPH:quinone reductase-like Zn-dependent oxidoreductase [Labrys monachus]
MKAIRINGYNATPALEDVEKPAPGPGEVLVRVKAAALNPLDVKLQRGYMDQFFPLQFPYTQGTDLAGEIEQVGPDVQGWAPGDKIVGRTDPTAGGAFAEYAVVPVSHLTKAPSTIAIEDAAGIPTAAGTAWQALFESARLADGQSILIHAGAGGVGSFAIQFARNAGARVFATASGDGVEIARQLGADKVIDYRSEDFTRAVSDVDIVLDTIGGETEQRSYQVLRVGGQLLATALPPDDALAKAHNVSAGFVFHASDAERLRRVVEEIDQRGVKVLLDGKQSLGDFAEAFEHQASGRARGKIIVVID